MGQGWFSILMKTGPVLPPASRVDGGCIFNCLLIYSLSSIPSFLFFTNLFFSPFETRLHFVAYSSLRCGEIHLLHLPESGTAGMHLYTWLFLILAEPGLIEL